jgi:Iron-containing redox enzyme
LSGSMSSPSNSDSFADRVVEEAMSTWDYRRSFFLPTPSVSRDAFRSANRIQAAARIQDHQFFTAAAVDAEALRLWVSQEAVVTGPFSQLLLALASLIKNVHLRAQFLLIATGEHNDLRDGAAEDSHPWLLHRLCVSVGLDPEGVSPLPFTVRFLEALASCFATPLEALGALGVGNERMLIPEYTAVQRCFECCYPQADYRDFLRANIEEDGEHCLIAERVARALAMNEDEARQYLDGAIIGVEARVKYYDELLAHHRSLADATATANPFTSHAHPAHPTSGTRGIRPEI